MYFEEAVLMWKEAETAQKVPHGERPMTALERRLTGIEDAERRNPNHQQHYTRNIRILQRGQPTEMEVKIHPPLIIEFNGETTCP